MRNETKKISSGKCKLNLKALKKKTWIVIPELNIL